jgi:signal transduction histidine kinase
MLNTFAYPNHDALLASLNMHSNYVAELFFLPALVSTFLAYRTWSGKYSTHSRIFSWLNIGIAFWSLTYGLELASLNYSSMRFWLRLEYLAIPFVPVLWFLVILENTGLEKWFKPKNLIFLFAIPILTGILSITNEFHSLYYREISINSLGKFPMLSLEKGPWYFINTGYAYLLTLISIFLLGRNLVSRKSTYRQQSVILFIGAIIPFLVSISYNSRFFPVENLDPLPIGFSLAAAVIGFGIYRYKIFDLIPFARDHIFQSMADGAMVIDQKKRLVECNTSAMNIFNMVNPPLGKEIDSFCPNFPAVSDLLFNGKRGKREIEFNNQGEIQYFEVTISEILNRKNVVIGQCFVFHDIKHRKKTEEQLRQLNAEKDKFFSIVAHDLRSPFNAFLGLSRIMAEDINELSVSEIQTIAESLKNASLTLYRQLENLLEWSQFQRGTKSFNLLSIPLIKHVENSLSFLHEAARQKEISFIVDIPKNIMVFADAQMLETLVLNLSSNALKFSKRGKTITIEANTKEKFAEISVIDQGIGMAPEILSKLFRIDQKVFQPGTEGEASSGLGLLLCREIVEKHGGLIKVESEVGRGSRFTFTIPIAPQI